MIRVIRAARALRTKKAIPKNTLKDLPTVGTLKVPIPEKRYFKTLLVASGGVVCGAVLTVSALTIFFVYWLEDVLRIK